MSKREFTNSELSAFQDCPQKWWFKYSERLTPDREKAPLSFGRIFHEAFNTLYTVNLESAVKKISDKYDSELPKCIDDIEHTEMTESKYLAIGMINNYALFAKENDDFTVIESETQRTVPVIAPSGNKSSAFDYTFKPDQVVNRNGQIWLHELKTAAMVDSNYLANLVLDEQMSRYSWALEKSMGKEVAGIIYTICRKTLPRVPELLKKGGLSKSMSIDTTYEIYLKAIKDNNLEMKDYADILEVLKNKPNTYIRRETVLRNQKEKKDCEKRLWTLCKTLNVEPPIYKCPSRDCSWKCDFRNLCIEDTEEARSMYKIREQFHPELHKEEVKANG